MSKREKAFWFWVVVTLCLVFCLYGSTSLYDMPNYGYGLAAILLMVFFGLYKTLSLGIK
jgi:hypothetical protein